MSERYIAAIEISSSKIIAAIGKTKGNGFLDIVAVEQEASPENGVRYGIIQNLEETSMIVARLFNRLEQRSAINPRKIKGVIVGLSGRSLKNITKEVSINLPEDTEINEEILTRLYDLATNSAIDSSLEVVDAVPRFFKVGTSETSSPKGLVGDHISGIFDLIVCRPDLKRMIKRTIEDKLRLKIEGFVVTAMATGHVILTPEEKRLGCMFVDMGAETTTMTIYQKGALHYFATLPMGGRNITRDIASLGVIDTKAEEIKLSSGNAIPQSGISTPSAIMGLKYSEISNIVINRSEEIVANIIEQISYAGLKESDLQGGIICIGGGIKLKGMRDLLEIQSGINVKTGVLPDYIKIEDNRAQYLEIPEIASIVYVGATLSERECLEIPEIKELPKIGGVLDFGEQEDEDPKNKEEKEDPQPHKPGFGDFVKKLGGRMGRMFAGSEDDPELL